MNKDTTLVYEQLFQSVQLGEEFEVKPTLDEVEYWVCLQCDDALHFAFLGSPQKIVRTWAVGFLRNVNFRQIANKLLRNAIAQKQWEKRAA